MNMKTFKPLLSERLRPANLEDLILPTHVAQQFERMIQERNILNMTFFGKPGTGKTSTARILMSQIGADCYEVNGSLNKCEKSMLKGIEHFSSTISLLGKPKVCLIDEADKVSASSQNTLLSIVEKSSGTVRFLFTANDIQKLTPALKSRCLPICFDRKSDETCLAIKQLTQWYQHKLTELGFQMETQRLGEIITSSYPDMRTIANRLQLEAL